MNIVRALLIAAWAAAGTLQAQDKGLRWEQTNESLALKRGAATVWQFGLDSIYRRPHFHPLTTPDGTVFTEIHPDDHPWHLGLWFQPNRVNGLCYWQSGWRVVGKEYMPPDESLKKGLMGLVEVRAVDIKPGNDFGAAIKTETFYMPKQGAAPLLREDRVMTVSPPDAGGAYHIDFDIVIEALEPIVFDKYSYGGFHIRTRYFSAKPKLQEFGDKPGLVGTGRKEPPGESRYLAVVCEFEKGKTATAVLFDHPDNINHPTAWLIHFTPGAALTGKGDIRLAKGETLKLRYRCKLFNGIPTQEEMDKEWATFAQNRATGKSSASNANQQPTSEMKGAVTK